MNLSKYTIYLKQLIDGMPSKIFSAGTFPPNSITAEEREERYANILKSSRERYSKKKDLVEWKINKWMKDLEKQEESWEERKKELKKNKGKK